MNVVNPVGINLNFVISARSVLQHSNEQIASHLRPLIDGHIYATIDVSDTSYDFGNHIQSACKLITLTIRPLWFLLADYFPISRTKVYLDANSPNFAFKNSCSAEDIDRYVIPRASFKPMIWCRQTFDRLKILPPGNILARICQIVLRIFAFPALIALTGLATIPAMIGCIYVASMNTKRDPYTN